MPSSPGISTSSRATSGWCSSTAGTTASPEPTSATTSRSGSRPSSADSAPRTSAWSSASSSRMVMRRTTDSEKPGESSRVTTVAPTAAARSRSPASPEPWPPASRRRRRRRRAPRRWSAVSRTSQCRAPECRITLVTPSRTVQANSSRSSDGTSSVEFGSSASISAARERDPRPGQLAGQGQLAVALDRTAYVGERVAAEPLEVGDLGAGPLEVDVEEPLGELGLHRDHGERVAEDVVQVAGEAGALVLDGEAGVLLLGVDQVDVAASSPRAARRPPPTRP